MMTERQPVLKENVAESILDAADRLIQRYGYSKTTVDDIAREAGIGKGSIYLHFDGKEDVALSCLERMHRRLQDQLWSIARGRGTAADRVRRILFTRVLFRFDDTHGYRPSLDELYEALTPRLLALKQRNHENEAQILAEVLTEGRLQGEFDAPEALPAARTMVLATNALVAGRYPPAWMSDRRLVEEALGRLVEMLLFGVSRHAAPEPARA